MTTKPLIQVDLGKNGGHISFDNAADIKTWVESEKNYWIWVSKHNDPESVISHYWARFNKVLNAISVDADKVSTEPDETRKTELAKTLAQRFKDTFLKNNFIHSTSVKAKFLSQLALKNEKAACYALWYFIGGQKNDGTSGAMLGIISAVLYEADIQQKAESQDILVNELIQKLQEQTGSFKRTLNELKENYSEFAQSYKEFDSKTRQDQEKLLNSHRETFDGNISAASMRLKELEEFYHQKLATEAPVNYWRRKATKHRYLSIGFAALVTVAFASAAYGIYCAWKLLPAYRTEFEPYDPLNVTLILISTGAAAWLLRILVRLFLSQVHLMETASEKVVMVENYLALLKESAGVTDNDRGLVLGALFRHTPTGLVKDDAAPPNLFDALARVFKTGH